MTLLSFPIRLRSLKRIWERAPAPRLSLSALASLPRSKLPKFVQESEVALKYMQLLGMLDWQHFPDRPDQRFLPLEPPLLYAPLVAAYLVKIDQHIAYVADLWQYLIENPALVWAKAIFSRTVMNGTDAIVSGFSGMKLTPFVRIV